jgi:hypothetical protein
MRKKFKPLKLTAVGKSGLSDVSNNHDYYLARDSCKVGEGASPARRRDDPEP